MPNWIKYSLIAAVIFLCAALNPSLERHRDAFVQRAQSHFFEMPRDYQVIFEQLRKETAGQETYTDLFYGNFLIFSTLTYVSESKERRLLSIGALGLVAPMSQ